MVRRKNKPAKGKLTGQAVPSLNDSVVEDVDTGMDDMGEFFDAAISPAASKDSESLGQRRRSPRRKTAPQQTKKTPSEFRTSLPGANDGENSITLSETKRYASKVIGKAGKSLTSPSDISRVSTLPPSPEKDSPLFTQPEEEVEVARHEAEGEAEPPVTTTESLGSPIGAMDHDDDDDDLGPPVLPDEDDSVDDPKPQEEVPEPTVEEAVPPPTMDDDDIDLDDDKEGPGFDMAHDPETPESVRQEKAQKELSRQKKKSKKRKSGDSEDLVTPQPKARKKGSKKKARGVVFSPQGIPIANRGYKSIPLSNVGHVTPDNDAEYGDDGMRRSRRTRYEPLAWWKNEKIEYGQLNQTDDMAEIVGGMPVPVAVVHALPTPYRKRKGTNTKTDKDRGKKKSKKQAQRQSTDSDEEPFDPSELRRKFGDNLRSGDTAAVWDDGNDETNDLKVVSYSEEMEGAKLPILAPRKKSEGNVVGVAAQAFNVSNEESDNYVGYIMGNLRLPPRGIKDSESVGPCSVVYTVCTGQAGSTEIAFAHPDSEVGEFNAKTAQRFLLGPGDMFRIPPGNNYRLQNHSKTQDALLSWTIIRPIESPEE